MQPLKQSTAATVLVGPVLDSTGAAVTTAVIGDFKMAKNGTTSTFSGNTISHDANGYYLISLTTGNVDTLGRYTIYSGNTAHSMATHRFAVLPASVYDALVTNATNSTGGLPTATGAIAGLAGTIATTTNITSASGVVLAAQTHTGATIPTVTSVTNGVTVSTNNDKTGYSLLQAFPTNFASLAITGAGAVTAGTVSDKTGYSLTIAPLNATQTADAVWNALLSSYTVAGSFGARVIRSTNSNVELQLTGSHHAAADIHELQPAVIDNTHFAAGAIDANALAADAATEIATAVGSLTQMADLSTMIINDGTANARFSTSALQNAPAGGGASTVNVLPYTGAIPDRVEGTTIKVFYNELTNVSVGVTDSAGTAVDVSAKTLRFCVEDRFGADVLTIDDASITKVTSTFTVQIPQSLTDTVGANYKWSLRDLTGSLNTVLLHGQLIVAEAAEDEA